MKTVLFFFIIYIIVGEIIPPLFSQQELITEKVDVNWWQVPIFVLDKNGNPVLDLKHEDITLLVNGFTVNDFVFHRRDFTKEQESTINHPAEENKLPLLNKQRRIFFLFDTTISDRLCIQRAKVIAKKILASSPEDIHFTIMSIEPFIGLTIHGETSPDTNREKLIRIINKKIVARRNERTVSNINDSISSIHDTLFIERKINSFFRAFDLLNFYLKTIEDNKFIYFFTEGVSNALIDTNLGALPGSGSRIRKSLEKVGQNLGKSGSILFIVNPNGVDYGAEPGEILDNNSASSGEPALENMLDSGGGKYFKGTESSIVSQIEKIQLAYYEISFPNIQGIKGNSIDISVKSNHPEVSIITMRSLAKNTPYLQMKGIEKELLALNLTSPNRINKKMIEAEDIILTDIKKSGKNLEFHFDVPQEIIDKNLDLFIIRFPVDNSPPAITKEIKVFKEKKGVIFLKSDYIEKKMNSPEWGRGEHIYFVLIDGVQNQAFVCGEESVREYLFQPPKEKSPFERLRFPDSDKIRKINFSQEEMQKVLFGTAQYCEKLKNSAFHFICNESIVESKSLVKPSFSKERILPYEDDIMGDEPVYNIPNTVSSVKRYHFSYRLIKTHDNIMEKREILKIPDPTNNGEAVKNENNTEDLGVKPTAFFSEKTVFAPVTLFDTEMQPLYNYRFITKETIDGHSCIVIDVTPQTPGITSLFGVVWIDLQDYSVIKIAVNPLSIKGYPELLTFAEKIKSRLYLSLEFSFGFFYQGLRFPTQVTMIEKYKGGPIVGRLIGRIGAWERNRTEFKYSDYKFFDVDTQIVEEITD